MKKQKKDKKDKKDAQIEALPDKVRRQMAEFENFRKRSEKEKTHMYEVGAKGILEKILPVVDNFERGLKGMEESEDPFAQGMQMIYKQLMTSLEEAGVKAIAVNKIEQSTPNLMDLILGHKIDLVIDTPPQGAEHSKDGFVIRRSAIETGVNVLTAIDTAKALITSLENTDIQKLTLIDIAKIK